MNIEGSTLGNLFLPFVSGLPMKRLCWKGYWIYRSDRCDTIEMHLEDGKIADLLETEDIIYTLANILESDWVFANVNNCEVLRNEKEKK